MRRFILIAHDARTSGDFLLDDLPGAGGRMDIVARCVAAALLIAHNVRRDAEFLAVLQGPPRPPRLVRFLGGEVHKLNPDERSMGAVLRRSLAEEGLAERSVHPGVHVSGRGLRDVLATLPRPVYVLREDGTDIRGLSFGRDAAFVLSDHRDFTDDEREAMSLFPAVSVGPATLHADQVIAIVHNELDRRA